MTAVTPWRTILRLAIAGAMLSTVANRGVLAQATQTVIVPSGTVVHRTMGYLPNGHERQVLDLYLPPNATGPLPVMVLVHGGGWIAGDKMTHPVVAWATPRLLAAGYAVAAVNYRYAKQAAHPALIHDVKAAVRWLRTHSARYGMDSTRVGIWGASAGAHLAALLGTTAGVVSHEGPNPPYRTGSSVRAVVSYYAPINIYDNERNRAAGAPRADSIGSNSYFLVGALPSTRPDIVKALDPRTYLDAKDPPVLLYHGDADETVPVQSSQSFAEALAVHGVEHRLIVVPGARHSDAKFRTDEHWTTIIEFLDRHVKRGR